METGSEGFYLVFYIGKGSLGKGMDEPNDFQMVERFQGELAKISSKIDQLEEGKLERIGRETRIKSVSSKLLRGEGGRLSKSVTDDEKIFEEGRFPELRVEGGRLSKSVTDDEKIFEEGRFPELRVGKLGDEVFADGILSVFNNIDKSRLSLSKVEGSVTKDEGRTISHIRRDLDEVIARVDSVVDKHIEVNEGNCSDCACDRMDNSFNFIIELQEFGNDFSTELKNEIEGKGDRFWSSMEIDDINEDKKEQISALIDILSEI